MEAKLARLTHKIAIQPFAVLAPGGQSGHFWIHPRILRYYPPFTWRDWEKERKPQLE